MSVENLELGGGRGVRELGTSRELHCTVAGHHQRYSETALSATIIP